MSPTVYESPINKSSPYSNKRGYFYNKENYEEAVLPEPGPEYDKIKLKDFIDGNKTVDARLKSAAKKSSDKHEGLSVFFLRGVLNILSNCVGDGFTTVAGQQKIAEMMSCSVRQVGRAIKWLHNVGVITTTHRYLKTEGERNKRTTSITCLSLWKGLCNHFAKIEKDKAAFEAKKIENKAKKANMDSEVSRSRISLTEAIKEAISSGIEYAMGGDCCIDTKTGEIINYASEVPT